MLEQILKPVEVFFSYSHEDRKLLERLQKHLGRLLKDKVISVWYDGEIAAGDRWEPEIFKHMDSADVILLLVSIDFLSSDYVSENEIPRAIAREMAGAVVIPIILRPVYQLEDYEISRFQFLPQDGKPVTTWPEPDEAFVNIVAGIRIAISRRPGSRTGGPSAGGPSAGSDTGLRRLLPYLCDRSDQERELTEALTQHQKSDASRPFICVVHGDEFQCHGDFVERMRHTVLKRTLKPESSGVSEPPMFEWPNAAVPSSRHVEVFRRNLASQLLNDPTASVEEIMKQYFARNKQPLVLTSILDAGSFGRSPSELIDSFLQFWHAWPDLPPDRTVIHFVCVKHLRLDSAGWMDRYRLRKISEELRARITSPGFFDGVNVRGVVLRELKGIRLGDVKAWSLLPDILAVREVADTEIHALFDRLNFDGSQDAIPMETLAGELKALLKTSTVNEVHL